MVGISAVSTVISYLSKPSMPKAHITPMVTTSIEIKVALTDLKKKKKIKEVIPRAAAMKIPISSIIFCEFNVRI